MTTLTVPRPRLAALVRVERLGAVLPLLTIYAWLCLIFGWEAWGNLTPWIFGDELEHAQLSRAIAETGHAARRGVPHSPDSIYSYVIAPAWWIHSTSAAYGVVKALGVCMMTAAIFPTYALARMLVSKGPALLAAAAAASIPALAYSSLILEEPLAYAWAALSFWLITRALVTPSWRWTGAAVAVALAAPAVRGELQVVPAAFVLAFALWWFTGEGGRRWRRGWKPWDWAGFGLLMVGVVIVFNAFGAHHSEAWIVATQDWKGRMVDYGLWALGALTIGIGVLPLIAGLAALAPGRWSTRPPAERAFICVALSSFVAFGYYTAIKAAFISTAFSTLVEERNIIYIAPLLFVGTALFFQRGRTHPLALAGAAALALYVITTTPYKMEFHYYADAPGLSILQSANRVLSFTPNDAKIGLIVTFAIAFAACAAAGRARARWAAPIAALAGIAVVAWNLTGEISGARASHAFANDLLAHFPRPLDWVDRATGRAPTVYYGQRIGPPGGDPNGVWLLEFWNRSLRAQWSTDGSGVGPGPAPTPDVVKPDGEIGGFGIKQYEYAVTDEGVNPVGTVIATAQHAAGGGTSVWRVFKLARPIRLQNNFSGFFPDGWTGERSSYNQFSTPGGRDGFLVVTVSREAGGKTLPANARLVVGSLVIGSDKQPRFGRIELVRAVHVQHDLNQRFIVTAPPAPFRARVHVWPTFSPHDLDPGNSDLRQLGAQISYTFVPRVPLPQPGKPPDQAGIYADRWMGPSASQTRWWTPNNAPGTIHVRISRTAWQGANIPGHVQIVVARLAWKQVGDELELDTTAASARRFVTVPKGGVKLVTVPTPKPPFRVELHASSTFVPARAVPGSGDTRELAAQVRIWFSGSRR